MRFSRGSAVALLLALAMTAPAHAQKWPDRSVRIVTPFASGGGTDVFARILAQRLTEVFGQQFIVENRPGAGSTAGTEYVAKRPLTVEQVPRTLARGCDPVAGCKRRT